MIAIGPENFRAMLAGFHAMDEHFRTAPLDKTFPFCWAFWASGTTISSAPRRLRFCLTTITSAA
jgi:hypothetical protein